MTGGRASVVRFGSFPISASEGHLRWKSQPVNEKSATQFNRLPYEILAAAFDERGALVIPHQAGQGGTSPARNTSGETVREINRDFQYRFNTEFKLFNRHPDRLPFGHHALIALVAPRPVLLSNATDYEEANPKGQFQMLALASRANEFLGEPGLDVRSMPPIGELAKSRLGYFIRPGKHNVIDEDWKAFLDFADAQMPKKTQGSLFKN